MPSTQLFDSLRDELKHLDESQVEEIRQAYLLAAEAHKTQERDTGEPYITHPVAVAKILAQLNLDKESIIAGLLHDVIEDTDIDKQTLTKQFGKQIAELVDGVSKLTQVEFTSRAEAEAENFQKMLMAMVKDVRVILVKLADRLHNMRTLEPLPYDKRSRVAKETLEIFAPIAKRLGMRHIANELEELGFICLYPFRYRVLAAATERVHGSRKQILKEIDNTFEKSLKKGALEGYRIHSRKKNLYSIYRKMCDKRTPFSEITDVYAVRIITKSLEDCYRALGIIHHTYKPMPDSFTDYIALPKMNGYQSLHTILFGPYGVPIEVQIRTEEMHEVATVGIAAHAIYKAGHRKAKHNQPQLKVNHWMKKLEDIQSNTGTSIEFAENVKIDLFPDEVYIFTPKGDIFELPSGSTVIDFAYALHTELGAHCVSAKVDRRIVPLSTKLTSGETVEIITASHATPNPAWLNFVITGKARSSIKNFLKNQREKESMVLGKRLLKEATSSLGIKLRQVPESAMESLLMSLKLDNADALFQELGLGNQAPLLVAKRIDELMSTPSDTRIPIRPMDEPPQLVIRGTEGMVVDCAECCHPIPGDPVIGELNAGQGILIHVETCDKVAKLTKIKNKCTPVRWAEDVVGEFVVPIQAEIKNRRGTLATLTAAIADSFSNIESIEVVDRQRSQIMVRLLILVKNRDHLAKIMRNARKSSSLLRITRSK